MILCMRGCVHEKWGFKFSFLECKMVRIAQTQPQLGPCRALLDMQQILQPSVRQQHNAGYKHKANVRSYYQQFEEQQTQSLIDQRIKEHLGQTSGYQQVGAAYNQYLASLTGNPQRPRLPVLPLPVLPIPGVAPPPLVPRVRPPMLPRPGGPGYGMAAPPVAPVMGQPPTASSLPVPLTLNGPVTVPGGVEAPGSNAAPSAVSQPMYQAKPPTVGTSSSSTAANS